MSDRDSDEKSRECRSEGARGVTLHDEEVRGRAQQREHRVRNSLDVPVRIDLARTAEAYRRIGLYAEFGRIETDVLASEHQGRRQTAIAERVGYRRQFDSFGPGPNDQPDISETQPSP